MVNAKFEVQRQTIKHYWLNAIHSVKGKHKKQSFLFRLLNITLKNLKNR
jgi:hypothetical protein